MSGASVGSAFGAVNDEWNDQGWGTDGDGDGGGTAETDEETDVTDGEDETADDDGTGGSDEDGGGDGNDGADSGDDEQEDDENGSDDGDDSDEQDGVDDGDDSDDEQEENDRYALTAFVEDENGDSIDNATVELEDEDREVHTEDGQAEFDDLADGEYELVADADGYEQTRETVEIDGDDEAVLLTLASADEDETNALTVLVEDDDGNSIDGVAVELESTDDPLLGSGEQREAETDDGLVEFEDLADGEYEITAGGAEDEYEETREMVELDGDDEAVLLTLSEAEND
ncbi:carboxypeptidase regulatory-like domain-containing protein [Natronobacterium haloterrestre]|uniref:carboxypeptidase regulatory-like domain-containing protein n=1 Tax=Natronobacterium haloterrestre TaxID=148448 RepID=UPI001FE1A01A|nr:carboxypeptidase regulatory-like domain-containing protein [Halobiforma haloterrestris]